MDSASLKGKMDGGTSCFFALRDGNFEQHAFYGTVKDVNSINVPVGTVIMELVNDVERGRITVTDAGKYGSENACGTLVDSKK